MSISLTFVQRLQTFKRRDILEEILTRSPVDDLHARQSEQPNNDVGWTEGDSSHMHLLSTV